MDNLATEAPRFADAAGEFAHAWEAPGATRFELPAVDVNRVVRKRYETEAPFAMTRTQLWDMEVKKAWDPFSYIPYVVAEGRSWGRHHLADGTERFFRASMQAGWITAARGQVLEEVFVDHGERRIFFMGRAGFAAEAGDDLIASDFQPLFHVEHAAGGTEANPLNIWRIVLLTEQVDARYLAPFEAMAAAGMLPGFVEIYIERDMGVALRRRNG